MLRLTELKLPLDHPPEAIEAAVRARLNLHGDELRALHPAAITRPEHVTFWFAQAVAGAAPSAASPPPHAR